MKYITSCPQCDTQFLLDDELIKAYRGKVQCGNCGHVFNAKNRLTEVGDDINSAEEYQASLEEDEAEAEADVSVEESTEVTPEFSLEEDDEEAPAQFTIDVDDEPVLEPEEVEIYINDAPQENSHIIDQATTAVIPAPGNVDDFSKHISSPHQKKARKSRPLLYSLLSILLIMLACIQSIYHMRVKIAAMYPQYKPMLVQACNQLKCKITLPQELNFISIYNDEMQHDDLYDSVANLSVTLKNNAHYPIAYPNIELTFTNSDEQIIIRKRLKPSEYLSKDVKISNGLLGKDYSTIKLALHIDQLTVAGYRILLAY